MAFIGKKPTAAPLTSSDVADGIITNAKLAQDIISAETALAVAPASTDELLISDAGTLKRIDYSLVGGANTPMFRAEMSDTQAITTATYTKVAYDVEVFDPQSTYDHATNYRWTPGEAGYYYISHSTGVTAAQDFNDFLCAIYKNGALLSVKGGEFENYNSRNTYIIDLADDDDYYEAYIYQNYGSDRNVYNNVAIAVFEGFKLIT